MCAPRRVPRLLSPPNDEVFALARAGDILENPATPQVPVGLHAEGRRGWTLSERDGMTHVRLHWRVDADRPLLRVLTPVLRPLFAWNRDWAIARAIEGLEPYAADGAAREDRRLSPQRQIDATFSQPSARVSLMTSGRRRCGA